jgi:hypothetical protein
MTGTFGRGAGQGQTGLRREVVVPVPAYRRATSLIGLSVASAIDAVVWTYQSQRRFWREDTIGATRPAHPRHRLDHHSMWRDASPTVSADDGALPAPTRTCSFPRD